MERNRRNSLQRMPPRPLGSRDREITNDEIALVCVLGGGVAAAHSGSSPGGGKVCRDTHQEWSQRQRCAGGSG